MLRVGIIGCGGIAKGKHMPSLKKIDTVNMVAFCDVNEEKALYAAKTYGAEGAKVYTDYQKMLKEERLDAVHVCTPNNSHAPISIAAMEAGCHVLCEKPMAKTAKEAAAMLETQKKTGKKLTIGYQNRFLPDSQYLKKACMRGDLGDIYFAKAHALRRRAVPTWGVFLDEETQGGGPLIDIGTHALDLTLWMMDNYKVKSVTGSVFKKLSNQTDTGNIFGDWKPEEFTVEDSAFGFIQMENGATIFLESSWALNILDFVEAKTTLCGTKAGADMAHGVRINKADLGKLTTITPDLSAGGVAFYEGESELDAGLLEARGFINAITNDTEPLVKPEQALVVTQILEAIYKSSKTGKTITF